MWSYKSLLTVRYRWMRMLLSVVIPVYNVRDYLARCVYSVLHQDFKDYEMILVDDGSTDGSSALCDELSEEFPEKIIVRHKENGGLSSARNAGLELARGQYIMLLDSDDWIEEGCLSEFAALFEKNYDMILGRAWSVDGRYKRHGKTHCRIPEGVYQAPDGIYKLTSRMESFCSPFFLYRTEFLRQYSLTFHDGILHEDELWTPLVLLKAQTIYASNISFYNHFQREDSIMHSYDSEKSGQSKIIVFKILMKEFGNYPRSMTKAMRDRAAMLYLMAVTQLKNPEKDIQSIGRKAAWDNAGSGKQKVKAFLFMISPKGYCRLVRWLRHYD